MLLGEFINGAQWSNLQRVTSMEAHRATACAARVAELSVGDDQTVGASVIMRARDRATPGLIDVLRRYPVASTANNRVAQLMSGLEAALR